MNHFTCRAININKHLRIRWLEEQDVESKLAQGAIKQMAQHRTKKFGEGEITIVGSEDLW